MASAVAKRLSHEDLHSTLRRRSNNQNYQANIQSRSEAQAELTEYAEKHGIPLNISLHVHAEGTLDLVITLPVGEVKPDTGQKQSQSQRLK